MSHITNTEKNNYIEIWDSIINKFIPKYKHKSGLSGGGSNSLSYDAHLAQDITLYPLWISVLTFGLLSNFKLGSTLERINLPNDRYILVTEKSTIARRNLNFSHNTFIDPGFKGHVTLELLNNSHKFVKLKRGQPIVQFLLFKTEFVCDGYNGKYQNQSNEPVEAR